MKPSTTASGGGVGPSCFIVSAPSSGGGKTTVAVGLMRALANRGLAVQSFKAGPDYVDPACHGVATGQPGLNLDLWTMGSRYVAGLLDEYGATADVVVIEGVMGLFDGAPDPGAPGSTAELARHLGVPVVLVIDATASAQSVAAIALGFQAYDPSIKIAGVIANRIASEHHGALVADGLAKIGIPYFGGVRRSDELILPDARGGLVLEGDLARWIEHCGASIGEDVDLEGLLQATSSDLSPVGRSSAFAVNNDTSAQDRDAAGAAPAPPTLQPGTYAGLRLALARDGAFCFYYYDALRWLEQLGIELVPFSPLTDTALPDDIDGILIGGGFPDRFAPALEDNEALRIALRDALNTGLPCYAEAGGFQYLLQELHDGERAYDMVGCLAGRTVTERRIQAIGNRIAEPASPSSAPWLADVGKVRGRVFHYGRPEQLAGGPAWQLRRTTGEEERLDGIATNTILASYLYVHWPTQPRLMEAFLSRCRRYRAERG